MDRANSPVSLPAVGNLTPISPDPDVECNDKDMLAKLDALPSVRRLPVPPTREQDELLQKTLDKYKVTAQKAVVRPEAVINGIFRGASYSCQVFFPKFPMVPRWMPVVQGVSSYFIGVKNTAVILFAAGVGAGFIGFFSGVSETAREIHLKTPEENLKAKKESLDGNIKYFKEKISRAREDILREKKAWHQIAPESKINTPNKVFAELQDTLIQVSEMTKEASVRFFEKELEVQSRRVQECKELRDRLEQSVHLDDRLEYLKAELDFQNETEALNNLRGFLESAKTAQIYDESEHIERQREVSNIITKSKFQALNEIYQRYLKAESVLKSAESDLLRVHTELVSVRKDEQQILLARQREMTPTKEDKDVPRLGAPVATASISQPPQAAGSRST